MNGRVPTERKGRKKHKGEGVISNVRERQRQRQRGLQRLSQLLKLLQLQRMNMQNRIQSGQLDWLKDKFCRVRASKLKFLRTKENGTGGESSILINNLGIKRLAVPSIQGNKENT